MELLYSLGRTGKKNSSRIMSKIQLFPDNCWEAAMFSMHHMACRGVVLLLGVEKYLCCSSDNGRGGGCN